MTDEYDSWRRYEDAEAFKNKLAEIDRLKDRIEKLEAALDEAAFSQTLFDAVVGQRNKATDRIKKLEDELHHCFHRIEELQTALREIAYTEPEDKYWPGRIARKALGENNE